LTTYFVYPIYTIVLLIITYALVPRREIRYLFRYGIIFGAVTDAVLIILVSKILDWGAYINYGPFAFKGFPFFPLIAWTAYFILYLYLLPKTKPWIYIFPISAAFYSLLFSNVLQNLGIFKWNWGTIIVPSILYLFWHIAVTWIYIKIQRD